MAIKRFKTCRTCGKQETRGWTEDADYICGVCRNKTVAEVLDPLVAHRMITQTPEQMRQAQRVEQMIQRMGTPRKQPSDPTRRALRNQGDDLDPLNPLSLTSPLNPAYHSDRADWDDSSHRHTSHDTSHDSGSSYDSGSDSTPSGGSCD